MAIYNDLGLIPSVGEWTVADGDTEINFDGDVGIYSYKLKKHDNCKLQETKQQNQLLSQLIGITDKLKNLDKLKNIQKEQINF